jgi:allantoin racemase
MVPADKKYRFLLVNAFSTPSISQHLSNVGGASNRRLLYFDNIKHLLDDVEWETHPGPPTPYGDWPVENREEFTLVAAGRLPIVKEACESGKYNGIVLLGGGDPGAIESREIGRRYGIPVTSCAWSQMHVATMLGNKFSVIDMAESHNMYYQNVVLQYRMADRCASIRSLNCPLPRPPLHGGFDIQAERAKGDESEVVERAVTEAVAAIEEDGAEVITFGCSASFWIQPHLQKRLTEMGWEVPVLEGYSCAITLAKLMVDLGVDASGLWLPSDRPKKWRRKKIF